MRRADAPDLKNNNDEGETNSYRRVQLTMLEKAPIQRQNHVLHRDYLVLPFSARIQQTELL